MEALLPGLRAWHHARVREGKWSGGFTRIPGLNPIFMAGLLRKPANIGWWYHSLDPETLWHGLSGWLQAHRVTFELLDSGVESAQWLKSIKDRGADAVGLVCLVGDNGDRALETSLTLAQILARESIHLPLWLVTEGGVAVDRNDWTHRSLGACWGLGRTLGWEEPQLWGALIDLPREHQAHDVATLGRTLCSHIASGELAIRGEQLWERRLLRKQHRSRALSGIRRRPF